MSAVGRIIASSAGAIATIGGVIGVYQLLASPSKPAISSTQDMIVAMVDQKVISLEDASRIAFALAENGEQGQSGAAESIQKIAAEGTDNQRKAIQLLSETRTREDGLELLQAEAETSSDWQTIAIFANGTDNDLAIEAIRKSIALEPDNFESLTLLSRLQSNNGDFADARRSAATASLLAETPLEKLFAAQSALSIVRQAGDVPALVRNIPELSSAIERYEASVDLKDAPSKVAFGEYRKEPLFVSGRARNSLASAYIFLDRNKAQQAGLESMLDGRNATEALAVETQENADLAIEQAALAIERFKKLAPAVDVEDRYFVISGNIGAHQTTAYAYFSKGQNDRAVEFSSAMLDLVRAEAETGSRAAIEALPGYYNFHSSYLFQKGDIEKVLETTRRSRDLQIAYARKYETEDVDLKVAGIEFAYAVNAVPLGEDVDVDRITDDYFGAIESHIAADPDDEDDF
ncbi:MAG: tetratricopeptide repeat protein, partial [Pseudomonadota bacterium]